jgi:GPH family glycoside/pentoside/hexuronide:cation symporter
MSVHSDTDRVGWVERGGYACGDLASCLYYNTWALFLMIFYTDTFGIGPAAAGTMLLVTRTWDTFADPVMGVISDRTRSRFGKFRPWLLWMCLPYAIAGVLTFITPNFTSTGKLIYAYVTYTLMMLVYTAINVPYGALLGVITPNADERTRLSSARFIGAFCGNFVVQGTLLFLVKRLGGGNDRTGFPLAMGLYAFFAMVLFLITFATTKERVQPQARPQSSIREDFGDLLRNRPWLVLGGSSILCLIWVSMRGAATLYYFKYFVRNEGLAASWLVAGTAATLVGVACTAPMTRWLGGRKRAFIWLLLLNVITCGALYFASPSNYILIFGTNIVGSFLNGPLLPLIWAMYADTADYAEWRFGRRSTGLIFSAGTFSQKMGWTVGGAVAGWLLAWFGFHANVVQTALTLTGIRMMMSLLPAGASVLTAIAAMFYSLDAATSLRVQAELKERRAADSPAVAI